MSAINQQHKVQLEFIRNKIKEVRTKIKRLDIQTIFKHATKATVTNMDHSRTVELISNMLKKGMVPANLKKVHYILCLKQQLTVRKKLFTTQMSMLERAIAFPGALIFHRYKNISTDHSAPPIKETGKSKHY